MPGKLFLGLSNIWEFLFIGAYIYKIVCSWALIWVRNIRQARKSLPLKNTLAYLAVASAAKKESFIRLTPGGHPPTFPACCGHFKRKD